MNVHRVWLALRIRVFFSLFSVWSSHFPKEASISCVCRKVCTFPIIFNTLYIYRVFASWRFAPSLFSLPHSPYIYLTSGTSELSLIILNVERNDRINYLHRIYPIYRRSRIKYHTSCTYQGEHDVTKKMEQVQRGKGEKGERLIPDVAPRIRGSR